MAAVDADFRAAATATDSDAPLTGLPRALARLYPTVAAARESAAIFGCAGPRARCSTELPLRLQDDGAASTPDVPEALVDWADARRAARDRVRVQVVCVDADFRAAAMMTDSDATLSSLPSGKTLNVCMTAVNDAGESAPSAELPLVVA